MSSLFGAFSRPHLRLGPAPRALPRKCARKREVRAHTRSGATAVQTLVKHRFGNGVTAAAAGVLLGATCRDMYRWHPAKQSPLAKSNVTTSTFVALSIERRIRMPIATEVMFVHRSEIATRHRCFTAIITTRMIETANRLVFVTRMAHGHQLAIRPRHLDVCSRANRPVETLFHVSA